MQFKWNRMKSMVLPVALTLLLAGSLTWGIHENRQRAAYVAQLQNMYTRSFYELVNNVNSMEVKLSKLMVSNSNGGNGELLAAISLQADNAAQMLGQLPTNHPALANTMGLIELTGDYCRSLNEKAAAGHPLTEDDYANLQKLYDSCVGVMNELQQMESDGKVEFNTDLAAQSYYNSGQDGMSVRFSEREKQGVEYPTLIYDGPFSETVSGSMPKGLPAGLIDEATAKDTAAAILGLPDASGVSTLGVGSGKIETFLLDATDASGKEITMQITREGGKLLQLIQQTDKIEPVLSPDECIQKAKDWLEANGFEAMQPTFTQQYDGQMVINFAPMLGEAVLYTDLVKAKVRMDDGKICGFDAQAYYMNHVSRTVQTPAITKEDAAKLVSSALQVNATQLAIIPTAGGSEQLCWEFRGTYNDATFLVYIDANTGEEANIFKIIDTDNGSLVV